MFKKICGSVFVLYGAVACTKKPDVPADPAQAAQAQLIEKGRQVYQTTCIACHNSDPRKAGPLGPEVDKSSRELLEARIMTATYPPGYKPKRDSKSMAALPHLKNDIEALHAFLNSL